MDDGGSAQRDWNNKQDKDGITKSWYMEVRVSEKNQQTQLTFKGRTVENRHEE